MGLGNYDETLFKFIHFIIKGTYGGEWIFKSEAELKQAIETYPRIRRDSDIVKILLPTHAQTVLSFFGVKDYVAEFEFDDEPKLQANNENFYNSKKELIRVLFYNGGVLYCNYRNTEGLTIKKNTSPEKLANAYKKTPTSLTTSLATYAIICENHLLLLKELDGFEYNDINLKTDDGSGIPISGRLSALAVALCVANEETILKVLNKVSPKYLSKPAKEVTLKIEVSPFCDSGYTNCTCSDHYQTLNFCWSHLDIAIQAWKDEKIKEEVLLKIAEKTKTVTEDNVVNIIENNKPSPEKLCELLLKLPSIPFTQKVFTAAIQRGLKVTEFLFSLLAKQAYLFSPIDQGDLCLKAFTSKSPERLEICQFLLDRKVFKLENKFYKFPAASNEKLKTHIEDKIYQIEKNNSSDLDMDDFLFLAKNKCLPPADNNRRPGDLNYYERRLFNIFSKDEEIAENDLLLATHLLEQRVALNIREDKLNTIDFIQKKSYEQCLAEIKEKEDDAKLVNVAAKAVEKAAEEAAALLASFSLFSRGSANAVAGPAGEPTPEEQKEMEANAAKAAAAAAADAQGMEPSAPPPGDDDFVVVMPTAPPAYDEEIEELRRALAEAEARARKAEAQAQVREEENMQLRRALAEAKEQARAAETFAAAMAAAPSAPQGGPPEKKEKVVPPQQQAQAAMTTP